MTEFRLDNVICINCGQTLIICDRQGCFARHPPYWRAELILRLINKRKPTPAIHIVQPNLVLIKGDQHV